MFVWDWKISSPINTFPTDTPNFPSRTPQNSFKPLRGILHHPRPRNALRSALKHDFKILWILSPIFFPSCVCNFRFVRSFISCYESCRIAIGETAFRRHRDAVSLRLIRRFAKMPPPIEVLRLNFRTTDMTAKRGKRIKKAAFCMLFEVF